MAYTAVPTVTTGDTWTAANHNAYIRDNFAAGVPDIFTTKGDIAVASAADVASRLGVGTDGYFLQADSGQSLGVHWDQVGNAGIANDAVDDTKVGNRVAQFYRRQGGSATIWSTAGSTDYTPTTIRVQMGTRLVNGSQAITFPQAFAFAPLVLATGNLSTRFAYITSISTTGCTLNTSDAGSATIYWLAVGPE